jgi:hypothetical protein
MINEKNNITIKAINNKMQLFLVILLWVFAVLTVYMNNTLLMISYLAICIILTVWLFTVKLLIQNELVIFKTGISEKKLLINSITSIGTSFNYAGTHGSREVTIKTIDLAGKDIKFNVKYFREKDIALFLKNILILNKNITLDEEFIKLLNKHKNN